MFLCFAPWRWVVIWVLEFTVKPQGSQYSPSLSEPFVDEKGNVPFSVATKEQVPSCCWLTDALDSVADTLNSVLLSPMLCNFCLCFWPWKCCMVCVSELNNFWQISHCKLTLPSCLGCSVGGVTGGELGVTWGRMGALLVTSCPLEFWNSFKKIGSCAINNIAFNGNKVFKEIIRFHNCKCLWKTAQTQFYIAISDKMIFSTPVQCSLTPY